jgi:hypothetical protein
LQEGSLLAAERHALGARFPEIVGARKRPEAVGRVVDPAFEVHLLAARILGEFQVPGLAAVGVEHLQAVEIAVAGHGREAPGPLRGIVCRDVEIIDVAPQARLVGPQHLGAERRAGNFHEAVGRRVAPGRREGPAGKGGAGRALPIVGADHVDRHVVRRREPQRDPRPILALAVQVVDLGAIGCLRTRVARDILDNPVTQLDLPCDPQRHLVVSKVHEAVQPALVEIAVSPPDFARKAWLGLVGDHRHGAHGRRRSEQRRLRALHDLHALEVIEIEVGPARPRDIDPVQVDGDGGRALRTAGVGRDAPDHEARIVGGLFLHVEPGYEGRKLVELGDAQFPQRLAGKGRDRDRHIHKALLDLLGGDQNLLAAVCRGDLLGRSRGNRDQCRGGQQKGRFHFGVLHERPDECRACCRLNVALQRQLCCAAMKRASLPGCCHSSARHHNRLEGST